MSRPLSWRRLALALATGALLLVASAASASPAPDGEQTPLFLPLTFDQRAEIEGQVPGYAGVHAERDRIVISLLDRAGAARARQVVARVMGPDLIQGRPLAVTVIWWDFPDLYRWHDQIRDQLWQVSSLSYTDMDEVARRIRVGVGTVEGRDRPGRNRAA